MKFCDDFYNLEKEKKEGLIVKSHLEQLFLPLP